MTPSPDAPQWPNLAIPTLKPTMETLQLWSQVVGKIRLAQTPWVNHSWHVALYLSARGLTTPLIPHGRTGFEIEFDFTAHELAVRTTDGGEARVELAMARTVSDFYERALTALSALGAPVSIYPVPSELEDATPFPQDHRPRGYDPAAALAYWRALVQADRVFHRFRTRFLGKCSPVHLFWGAFDLAVTRFSGRRAPLHPGGVPHLPDAVTREAYSHEVSSAGFWPGGGPVEEPCFYSYAYPAPEGFGKAVVAPADARWNETLGEFLLPYEAVRTAPDPDAALIAFLQSTYEAAADLARWDRTALECIEGRPGRPRPVS